MGLRVGTFGEAVGNLEALLSKRNAMDLMPKAIKALRAQMKPPHFASLQKSYDAVVEAIEESAAGRARAALAKSEADSSDGYSRDFFVFGADWKPSRTLAEEDHAKTVSNLQAVRNYLASMQTNFDAPTGVVVQIDDVQTGESVVSSVNPQDAAHGSENIRWARDLAPGGAAATSDQLAADAENAERGIDTNFSGSFGGPATRPNGSSVGQSNFAKRRGR